MTDTLPAETTAARILDIVEALMMERGFNAISYQDISERVGIRKASIHYHFPAKADLGAAVIRKYSAKLGDIAVPLDVARTQGFARTLETFFEMFAAVGASTNKVCLGGMLGAEFESLPEAMQSEVREFYARAQSWLGELLDAGRAEGVFAFSGGGANLARTMFSTLEGALIIGRALGDADQLRAVTAQLRALAGVRAP